MKDVFILEDVEKIVIDTGSYDLKITTADREDIQVTYDDSLQKDLTISFEKGTFKIEGKRFNAFSLFNFGSKSVQKSLIELEVPNHEYTEFCVSSLAGEVDVANVSADILKLNAKAGDFNLIDTKTNKIETLLGAGDLDIVNVSSNELYIKCKAGDVDVEDSIVGDCTLILTAGDIEFRDVELDKVDLKLTAGDIDFIDCKIACCKGSVVAGSLDFTNCELDREKINVSATAGDVSFN